MVSVEDSFISGPRASVAQAAAYAMAANPRPKGAMTWRGLAELYWYYAPLFRLDPLLPWAQMLHETGNRDYGGSVNPNANNYAGLGAVDASAGGLTYRTPQYGVLGHLVHVASYVHTGPVNRYCTKEYDPRLAFWDGAPLLRHLVRPKPAPYMGRLLPERRWANPGTTYAAALARIATSVQDTRA